MMLHVCIIIPLLLLTDTCLVDLNCATPQRTDVFSDLKVARSYSIEHNCDWTEITSQLIQSRLNFGAYSNLRLHCVNIQPGKSGWGTLSNFEHANYQMFRSYVDAIATFQEPTFDRVLIDGRASK